MRFEKFFRSAETRELIESDVIVEDIDEDIY